MPTFEIIAPDGRKFRVTGPEGSTKEQALERVKAQYSQGATEKPPPQMAPEEPYDPTAGQSFFQNFAQGVGKSFVDTGRGISQLAADAGAKVAPSVFGPIAENIRAKVDEAARLDRPLMSTGGGIVGNIGGQAAQFAVPFGGAVGGSARLGARLARGAGVGAVIANTQPVTSEQTRLGNTVAGAIGGAAGEGIAAGIGRIAAGSSSKITPEVAALAKKADELGIPLRAEQVTGSRPLAGVSAALDAVPFSGRDASRAVQRTAFNRAVARTFGESTDNLATAVRSGQARLGAKYDAILTRYPVKADAQFVGELDDVLQAARNELNDAQFSVIRRQVDGLLSKVGAGDQIDAQAAYNIKKVLDRIGRQQDTSVAHHAGELRDALIGALDRSLPADVSKEFAKTRAQYANLIAVRKLVKPGIDGSVTPAGLGNVRNLRGELKDVADVGAAFLKEPFGNSGTQNRLVGAGLIGGLGTGLVFEPTTAATTALAGATLGRGANALLQSPAFVGYQLGGSNALRTALPYTNRLLPLLGATGAVASQ